MHGFVHWSWKNIPAAAPLLVLAAAFGNALLEADPGIRPFARILRTEGLVIHSFPFVVAVALARPKRVWKKLAQWGVILGLMLLYSVAALNSGWDAVALFLGLTVATYLGFLLNLHDERTMTLLVLRWLVMFVLFILVGVVADLPERMESWNRSSSTLYTGLAYFGILGALEAIGFYQARMKSS